MERVSDACATRWRSAASSRTSQGMSASSPGAASRERADNTPAARAVADMLSRPEEHPITAADFGRSIDISAKQMHAMGMAAGASLNAAVARRLKEGR